MKEPARVKERTVIRRQKLAPVASYRPQFKSAVTLIDLVLRVTLRSVRLYALALAACRVRPLFVRVVLVAAPVGPRL